MSSTCVLPMRNRALLGVFLLSLSVAAVAQITVNTNGSSTISYPFFSQSAGPFPWTDIGIKVGAGVTPGSLTANVGGSTAFSFDTSLTNGQAFTPNSTVIDLGYNPAWTGSVSTQANGNLNSQLAFNIGPISGSIPIAKLNLNTGVNGNLGLSLNSSSLGSASHSVSSPTIKFGGTLEAPFDIARLTMSLNFSAQLKQTVAWNPTVTYGDLVWYSTSQSLTATDNPTFVAGSGGHILDTFTAPPASLGLNPGDTFYMNILPTVELSMPVGNEADIGIPVSFDVNGQVFGNHFDYLFPLGDLYDLSSGNNEVNFNGTWYGNQFYSLAIDFDSSCPIPGVPCTSSYVGPTGSDPGGGNNGIPDNVLPPINLTGGNWPDGASGPGTTPNGPLFPNGNCSFDGTVCFNTLTFTGTPEPGSLMLLLSGTLGLAGFLRRRRS